jgi:hypothetical protein
MPEAVGVDYLHLMPADQPPQLGHVAPESGYELRMHSRILQVTQANKVEFLKRDFGLLKKMGKPSVSTGDDDDGPNPSRAQFSGHLQDA